MVWELVPLTSTTLITLAEAKECLGVSGADDDTVITFLIEAATAAMESAAGRRLASVSIAETIDGTGARFLWLNEPPESVTNVHVSSTQTWNTVSLVDSDDYEVDGCALDYRSRVWTSGRKNVRVVYSAGYSTVPDDLQQACKVQVAKAYSEWQQAKKGMTVLSSQTVQGWAQKYRGRGALDPETVQLLSRYLPERL